MNGPVSSSPHITSTPGGQRLHSAAIALGSNLGDKFYNIELALRLLETPEAILEEGVPVGAMVAVVDTSFMYESAPMYVTDQPAFINCACIIETNLAPIILLKLLKGIESTVGRVPSIRNGPRAVDLDIVLYDREVLDTRSPENRADLENLDGELIIPHPRMSEREFVLRPLNDMIPDYIHPILAKPIHDLLTAVPQQEIPLHKVIPFPKYPLPAPAPSHRVAPTLTYWSHPPLNTDGRAQQPRRTRLMATLNTTPDSFSDGATHNTPATALAYACAAVNSGASIIDVGGYSTRPGAAFVSVEEELARVIPVIEAVRGSGDTPISVDTFRHEVAEAAVLAGANCINDVYAFAGPGYPNVDLAAMDGMKRVARDLGVPVVLMHSRGDAGKNKDYGDSVLTDVQVELGARVETIIKGKGGVRRWLVIVDPGIGFSKTLEGNLELLRGAAALTAQATRKNLLAGYPLLLGASRKSFLGVILAEGEDGRRTEPQERVYATAVAVTCAVQQGAMIVRVHDVGEMADVVRVADRIWG